MSRTSLFLLAGFLIGLAASACGTTTATCSAATCGGCCSASGKCEAGSSPSACGINGATCGRCGSGTVCQLGECTVSSNLGGGTGGGTTGGGTTGGGTTGGGTTGGGGATGGGAATGGGSGCRTVATVTTQQANLLNAEYRTFSGNNGFYNMALWGLVPPLVSGFDGFRVEVVYPNGVGPIPPVTSAVTAQGYRACSLCALFYETCDMMGDCQKEYLAQSGSVTISRADRNANEGRIVGSASNLRFVEWNLMTDTAVPGGGCIIATTVGPWDVGWNADGGMPPP